MLSLLLASSEALARPVACAPTPIAVYTSELCVLHDPGKRAGELHPEQPARLSNLLEALHETWKGEFGDLMQIRAPEIDVTRDQLLRVHTEAYLKRLDDFFIRLKRPAAGGIQPRLNLDPDTVVATHTQAAANRASGLVCSAVDEVFGGCVFDPAADGKGVTHRAAVGDCVRRAFVMVRPPGHHAEAGRAGGFCVYNNVLVGVAHAQHNYGLTRVAIIDFDVHHGNGDADIAWCDATRLYASSHELGIWPHADPLPACDGLHGQILSADLPPASGSTEFRRAWRDDLLPAIRSFEPEAIFMSAGFDAHEADPMANLRLKDDDFHWITSQLTALGDGGLPIISVLEGGHNVDQLPKSVKAHLDALIQT